MISWHDLAFYSSVGAFSLMAGIVLLEGRIYLGFTAMGFLILAISSNSGVIINRVFSCDPRWLTLVRAEACFVNALGLFGFCFGIISAIILLKYVFNNREQVSDLLQNQRALTILFLIGTIAGSVLPLAVNVPTLGAVQSQLEWLSLISLFCWIYGCRWNIWLIGVFVVWLSMCLIQISRTGHIGGLFYLLQLGLVVLFGKQITSWRLLSSLGFFVIFFLLIGIWFFVFRPLLRGEVSYDGYASSNKVQNISGEIDKQKLFNNIWANRIDFTTYYGDEHAWVPLHENYAGWSTIFPAAYAALIPRVLWRDKSVVQGGTEYVNRFTGADFDPKNVQFNMPFPFEFYAMFGWRGVVTGMFLLGFVIAYLERLICLRKISVMGVMIALAVLETLYTGGDQIRSRVTVLGAALGLYILLGMILESIPLFKKYNKTECCPF